MSMKQVYKIPCSLLFYLFSQCLYAAQTEATFVYVGSTEHSAYSGLSRGLAEANLQGQFLGQKYHINIFADAAELAANSGTPLVIVAAVDTEELLVIRNANRYTAILNLVAEDDSLRSACLGNILSIIPSKKMLGDAISQWRQKHPESVAIAAAWHEDFVKFAARDLNKRYRKTFDKGMDEYAWAGWAAVRMVADTVAREAITNPVEMLYYLKTNLSFDGQKGLNMNFRETGQLRQLLLMIENNELVGEAPVRGVSNDIDSLGIRECAK